MYRVDGSSSCKEEELDHFEGYCGSRPVRVGNGAPRQLQLDIYGELVDAIYVYNKYGGPIYYDAWDGIRSGVDRLCEEWDQPDEGIWETRGGARTSSSPGCSAGSAIDRGRAHRRQRSLPADVYHWRAVRDRIYGQITSAGWNEKKKALRPALRIGRARRLAADDAAGQVRRADRPALAVDARRDHEELVTDSLVHRYNPEASPDGLAGDEGTFSMCSFW